MILLQVNGLVKSFSGVNILENIQLEIKERDRVALVGRNGAGKSTLLKMIAGEMSKDEGDIIMPKNTQIGYLAQHTGIDSALTIWDEMMTVFEPIKQMERRLREIEQLMADPLVYSDEVEFERVTTEYDALQTEFKNVDGYQYESDTRSVLHGMRFYEQDFNKKIDTLSGGQKTRLALAKMLLSKPDLLILDEPTNHLDIETLGWLEKYLLGYSGALLVVSHDRYFLDQIVTIVYEISRTRMTKYHGNYSDYLTEKSRTYERDLKTYEREMSEKAKLEDFIQRNIARASTSKMAQSRRKMLERTEWMDAPDGSEKSASFAFSVERQSGNDVLAIDQLAIGYENMPVADQLTIRAYRGERIAIIGPNGVGKSTLLKTIVKKQQPVSGSIHYGTNVQFGYYDQEQATLHGNNSVLDELWNEWPLLNEKEVRSVLGQFLFSGDDVNKHVSTLSGGEKARLALAKLMLEESNTLILDEPTNHLDLDSKEILENALDDFPGTILFVSHDRYFINRIATKVIEINRHGAIEYLGDYDYFLEKKQELLEIQAENEAQQAQQSTVQQTSQIEHSREEKRQLRRVTRAIEAAENELSQLDEQLLQLTSELEQPEHGEDHVKLMEIQAKIDQIQQKHDEVAEHWLTLQEQLETFS